jgi:hypothetical protein
MSVKIEQADGRLAVSAPYHPDFPAGARKIGGRFNGTSKEWSFDLRDESRVRALCVEIYGTDGQPTELVTVRLDPSKRAWDQDSIWLCGRKVAWRPGRDDDVRLGDGVIIISGGFPGSGGSRQYPRLGPKEGTILEVRDLPAGHSDLTGDDVEVVDGQAPEREALESEKARLLERLTEIDKLLDGSED